MNRLISQADRKHTHRITLSKSMIVERKFMYYLNALQSHVDHKSLFKNADEKISLQRNFLLQSFAD